MAIDFASAVSAYQTAHKSAMAGGGQAAGVAGAEQAGGKSFGAFVQDAMGEAVRIGHNGEQVSKMAIQGKADLRDVVMAANNAEMTLQTVISVRNKVTAAYEQILRMPI